MDATSVIPGRRPVASACPVAFCRNTVDGTVRGRTAGDEQRPPWHTAVHVRTGRRAGSTAPYKKGTQFPFFRKPGTLLSIHVAFMSAHVQLSLLRCPSGFISAPYPGFPVPGHTLSACCMKTGNPGRLWRHGENCGRRGSGHLPLPSPCVSQAVFRLRKQKKKGN